MSAAETILNGVNISIRDMSGEIRPVSNILEDLSVIWHDLSDEQRQNLGVTLAGRYQLSRFLALMNNFSIATDATAMAMNSQNSAMNEQEKFADSLQGRINRLDTAWNKFTLATGQAVLTDGLIAGVETLNDLATVTSKGIDLFGVLSGVFGTLGIVTVLLSSRFRAFTTALVFGTSAMTRKQLATAGLTSAMTRLGIASMGASTALRGLLIATGIGAIFAALGFAVEKLVSAYSNAKQKQEEFQASQQKNVDALTSNKEQTEGLINSYKRLTEAKEKSGNSWDVEREKEYLSVQQQLGELFPSLIDYIDATGQNRLKSVDAIDTEIQATRELIELKKEETRLKAIETFQDNISTNSDTQKEIDKKKDTIENLKSYNDLWYASEREIQQHNVTINKLEQEIVSLQSSMANASLQINSEVLKLANSYNKLDIDPSISKNIETFIASLDMSNLDPSSLESYGISLGMFTDKIQKAYSANDSEAFNKAIQSLVNYAKQMGATDLEASTLSMTLDDVIKNNEMLESVTYSGADGMGALEVGLDGASDAVSGLVEAQDELKTVTEQLLGVSNNHINKVYEMISVYELLTETENLSEEQKKLLADSTSFLASVYPTLVNGSNANIKMMKREIESSDILRQAIDKMSQGQVSAQDQMTISAAIGTKNRLNLLKKEIQAYNEYFSQAQDNANTLEAEKLATKRMSVISVDIDSLMEDMDKYTSSLSSSLDINGKYTQAEKEASEATSKAAKEKEESIYITDKYKSATEKLNLELEKQNAIQSKYPQHSKKYQDSLKNELKLLDQKKKLLQDQAKSLEKQIKSGNIQQTGIIKSSSSFPSGSYSGQYASSINQAASKYGVDPNLIAAIIQVESNFNPKAKSGAGAQGLMQLMPGTARELGVKNAYDPHQNIMGGTKYISQQISKFGGDIQKALWAYNAGAGNVSKILNSGNSTWTGVKNYADKVLKIFNGSTNSVADYYLNNFRQTSHFGDTHGRNSAHKGLDFANGRQGDPVKALRGGKVITASYSKSAGNWVVIQQDDGMVAKYMHMQNGLNVKAGQQVKAGDVLGKVGNTGQSTGAHLHLQIEQNGKAIDPLKYLNGMSNGSSYAEQMQSVDNAKSDLVQLQQDILSIEAQMQELYMAIVESHLAAFDRKKASYEDDLAKIDLIQKREVSTSQEWIKQQLKKEDIIKKQIEQEKQAIKYLNQQIKANKDLNEAQKALLEDQLVGRYTELYSLESGLLDERISMADQIIDTYKKAAEAQKNAALSAIDEIIKGINKEADEADYKKRLEKAQKERQEILDEMATLALDDSPAARKKLAELDKQLQEKDESITDMQDDKARNDRIDNLNEEKEKIESDYENLVNDERKFNKMRSDIINANSKQIQKDLDKYYKNIKDNTNVLGKALSNNLIDLINQANRYLNGKEYKPIKVAQAKDGGLLPNWGSSGRNMIVHEGELISSKPDTQALFKVTDMAKNLLTMIPPNLTKLPSLISGNPTTATNTVNVNIAGNVYGEKHLEKRIAEVAELKLFGGIVNGVKIMGGNI